MGKMYRIALGKALLFVRLVIIVSLAGYTLSNANAAMHGSAFPETSAVVQQVVEGHHEMISMDGHVHDHGEKNGSKHDGNDLSKQECCKDFCGGFGIICDGHDVGGPIVSSIRQFVDDRQNFGELPSLNRPPNI